MIIANTNYTNTLQKIEQLKLSINNVQKNIENQIPQELTIEFEKSKLAFLNWVDEVEVTLNEFKNKENE
ncbi:MAG TPA: hypothetical protein PLK15_03470 [Chitinophagales bacterium]|jgi:hypothetical protein|nr:hypothetical protein [Chitinophagales bacterium]